jgi:orotate phosphoribosyltransferase
MADIQTPDGTLGQARSILELSERLGALKFGEFKLSSGGTSNYYFDGRLVTLDPEGAHMVARALLPLLRECKAEAVAGPALGAVPMVSSIVLMSYTDGYPINGLIVRQDSKGHGTKRTIEGSLREGARVVVVDDTCSTGGSLIHAIEAVEAAGCEVVRVICILDRRSGGSDAIRQRGYDFATLLEANEKGEIGPSAS